MNYQRINYEGAVVQVTEDTARDLIGRGLATPAGAVIDVPAAVVDVPSIIGGEPINLPGAPGATVGDTAVAFSEVLEHAAETAAPAKGKGRRK